MKGEREESPDSESGSQSGHGMLRPYTDQNLGNAPGNARGLRNALGDPSVPRPFASARVAATESATENRPPVMLAPLRQARGSAEGSPLPVERIWQG
jgi:hypothetical protein